MPAKKPKKRDTTGLQPAPTSHGLSGFMDLPMLLGTPEDVVPRALAQMDESERELFSNLASDLQQHYPTLSNLQAAHMALASMVMEQSLAFARRRGFSDLSESNVAALEWARKVYNQNVTQALKDVDEPERESNWMKDLEEFEITRTTSPDGTVRESARGRRRGIRAADVEVIDADALLDSSEPPEAASSEADDGEGERGE